MGFFGNLFGGKSAAYKKFEKLFGKVLQQQIKTRDKDGRNAFLTGDLLRNRDAVTQHGKASLVLDYGKMGLTKTYTLADLNKMAKASERAETKFETLTAGVPYMQLIAASSAKDIFRAKTEIRNSILYKIHGNTLHFRASASDQSKYTHHQVKIRLEEWDKQVRGLNAGSYQQSAAGAATGRISFNCDCGRHRFWYRYLATIGGFGLDPDEHVFPKIRNPGLKGCCCKHVLKTLATLRMSQVHGIIAKEMESQGKEKGFFTKLFKGKAPQEKFLDDDIAASEEAGKDSSVAEMQKEFKKYKAAQKGFGKKMSEPATKKALVNLKTERDTYRNIARTEKASADQRAHDLLVEKMKNAILMATHVDKIPIEEAIKKFATDNGISTAAAKKIAKQVNL